MVGQGKTPLKFEKNMQTFCVSLVVILNQTVTELFDFSVAGPVLRTVRQYSVAMWSRSEAASDVLSSVAAGEVRLSVHVKLGDSRSNRC